MKYRLDDNETDVEYHLVPAKYDNAITLAKIVKFVWMEAYDEIWGIDMTRTYVPNYSNSLEMLLIPSQV